MQRDYKLIESLDEAKEKFPNFVSGIEYAEFGYDNDPVAAGCSFKEEESCGLKNCHSPHKYGFIIRTATGEYYNIGQHCGKKYFDVFFKEWEQGRQAFANIETEKKVLSTEPQKQLDALNKMTNMLETLETVSNSIRKYIPQIAKEAADKLKERKGKIKQNNRKDEFKGLEFIANPLMLIQSKNQCEYELKEIIQAVENGKHEDDVQRNILLKKRRAIKNRIEKMGQWKIIAESFFDVTAGLRLERGKNLIDIFSQFKCAFEPQVKDCDVRTDPGVIRIPQLGKEIRIDGVFQIKHKVA